MQIPAITYIEATRYQAVLKTQLAGHMGGVNAPIAPTIPFVAPAKRSGASADGDEEIIALSHANLTVAPSISIAYRQYNGLPVGLQLTGMIVADKDLITAAALIARILRWGQDLEFTELGGFVP
ncbi:amidase family protein [Neorhizobium sp. NCHU2750]|uniref:amidase family protein n=1 Tax=Neorhizobium sp. NCHU2750 TaxID=1825976 RepID=UPI000E75C807|nr:hypothetical protein NCHU2750_41900 [Neorhizobium sp. NCHU2750]